MILIMSALFLGQGVSVAAAMCRHGSADAHATARDSRDGSVSAAALLEETAASVVEKKGALSGSASLHTTVADLPPALMILAEHNVDVRPRPWPATAALALVGQSTSPLLRPPSA